LTTFYSAKTQFENLGDWGIALALLHLVSKHDELFLNTASCPPQLVELLEAIPRTRTTKSNSVFFGRLFFFGLTGRAPTFLLKPGHFFGHDDLIKKRIPRYFLFLLLFLARIRIMRFGASIGPFSKGIEALERLNSACFQTYGVRETISLNYVKSLACKNPILSPDLGFAFLPSHFHASASSSKAQIKDTLSFSFRKFDSPEHLVKAKLFIQSMSMKADTNRLSACIQVSFDKPVQEELINALDHPKLAQIDWSSDGVNCLFSNYSSTRFIVSNRLHVLLFAASLGALPIALISPKKDTKILGIFQDNKLDRLVLDITSDADHSQFIAEVIRNESALNAAVSSVFQTNHEYIDDQIAHEFEQ
jgi:polysaccharide pyruvyl transferase WcaK-like protein